MTDSRGQSDASTMNKNSSDRRRERVRIGSLHITSSGHSSNVINIGVGTASTRDFNGAIFVHNNHGNRLRIQKMDRYRRRERQRMRQSQSSSEAEIVEARRVGTRPGVAGKTKKTERSKRSQMGRTKCETREDSFKERASYERRRGEEDSGGEEKDSVVDVIL